MIDLVQLRAWAEEAVSKAASEAHVTLDYSRTSIGALEEALDKVRQGLDENDTWDLACRFGAYFGETMLRNDFAELGYAWEEDYDGEPCLITSKPQEGASLDKILPITKVNKYLLSGPTESPAKLYAMCLSMLKGGDVASILTSLGVDPSKIPGVEPAYVNKGKFDANAAAWLLYGDYVFFRPQEIGWDGTTHRMLGGQVNAAKMNEIPTIVANTSLLNGLLDLLTELEKDEGLRVPLAMIHPGLHGALRNEDLTGITLFNLMACAQALIIKEPEPDDYQVMCDSRLPVGIPAFYQLVSRMIWGMRAYNDRSGSYKVTFVNARNFDADAVLDEVDQMVPGAFSQPIWQVEVTERPQVELPSMEEVQAFAREASRVFASGFDDPMDIQADEDLFVATLNQLAREFPLTKDIEGTHHMGRIPRIEHVKVGDPLVLAADWQSEFFDPVCIEVFNAAGETLGNLREQFSPTLSGNRELACLLPHLTATVETVTPKSKRRRNAKYALMDVRMELDPAVMGPDGNLLPEVIRDAKALLALPRGERVLVSKGGIVASQLKGNIKVDEAHDVANPLGSTFHLWEVELPDDVVDEPETSQAAAPTQATTQAAVPQAGAPSQVFDTGRWTFDRHQRVQARRFSIEVPDQWDPGNDEGGRVLGQYVQGIEDESEYPQILCNSMLGDLDDEAQELMRNNVIPETRVQMQRKAVYSNDMANKIMRSVNDWVVEGKNCQVIVFEHQQPSLFPDMFPDSYEYHVKPVCYDNEDFIRLADSWGHLGEGGLKALALAVAATVELDAPVELRRPAELVRYGEQAADADAFCETVGIVANMLNMSGSDRMTANLYRAVRQANNDMQVLLMGDTMPLIQAEAFNESLYDEVAYFGRLVQALEKQAELGTDGFDRMWKLVGEFGDGRVVDHVNMEDNKESEAKINALGVIRIPEEYEALRKRWEALRPGPDGRPGKPSAAAAAASTATAAQRRADSKTQTTAEEQAEKGVLDADAGHKASSDAAAARQQKSVSFADRVLTERQQSASAETKDKAKDEPAPLSPAHERRMEELRKKWAEEAARREAGPAAPSPAKNEEAKLPAAAVARQHEAANPTELRDPRAESARIARENAEREEKLEQLRTTWQEESVRKDERGPVPEEKKRGKGKGLLALLVLATAIVAAVLVYSNYAARQKQKTYESATALLESRDYEQAAVEFGVLGDYEDSAALAKKATRKARKKAFKHIKPGKTITLGSYEQDNDISNGPEPIEWIVLDVKDDKALLLSYYGLDAHVYNVRRAEDKYFNNEKLDNSWDQSSLKGWMQDTFSGAAFSEAERVVYLADEPLCLNATEATRYLLSENRVSKMIGCIITPYAAAQCMNAPGEKGLVTYKAWDTGAWWLRQDRSSGGIFSRFAPLVFIDGRIMLPERNFYSADSVEFVRPAVYVYLK